MWIFWRAKDAWLNMRRGVKSLWRYLHKPRGVYAFNSDILERGRYGFAERDVWGLCNYLNTVLIGALKHLRDNHYGVPACICGGDSVEIGDARWNAILDEIIAGLEAGEAAEEDCQRDDPRYEQHKRAIELLAEHWWHLWD